ncbi:MFS transporter [Nocardia rhamnosiphila]|uniref:MFS transporter n=1 Tax=Nocardia rhamnosiphila TaxID=426716 RepID=UPI0004C40909|nr:MFS transporter [Nocardia rhamnosiphila]
MVVAKSPRLVLAMVCAVAVSTIYAIQPVLEKAGAELGLAPESLGRLVAAGQIGYFAGLVLLVPLGDILDRRRLITGHLLLTGAGAATAAVAPNAIIAVAGLAMAGLFAVVVQVTVAYVAAISAPHERGRNIGAVTSGVVIGILGVRVLAGLLGDTIGWRAVYVLLAAACAALAVTVRTRLRPDPRSSGGRYPQVLMSMGRSAAKDPLLLGRGVITFFVFASFGTLWSGLALPLGAQPWTLGTTEVGLFGLAGLAGAAGAARAGRWADSGRAQSVTGWSLVLLAASWLLIARTELTLWLLVIGIVALDFAVQAVHVSSQHLLTAAHPDRTGSVIGAYMAFYSLGSALGAITTTWAYTTWGWQASCLTGALYALGGLVTWGVTRSVAAARRTEADSATPLADSRGAPCSRP